MSWAALIKRVYETDPLRCPNCGGTMRIVGFISKSQPDLIEKILRHRGLWHDTRPRAPPEEIPVEAPDDDPGDIDFVDPDTFDIDIFVRYG